MCDAAWTEDANHLKETYTKKREMVHALKSADDTSQKQGL
jgi:hypothetical protein